MFFDLLDRRRKFDQKNYSRIIIINKISDKNKQEEYKQEANTKISQGDGWGGWSKRATIVEVAEQTVRSSIRIAETRLSVRKAD